MWRRESSFSVYAHFLFVFPMAQIGRSQDVQNIRGTGMPTQVGR